MDLPLIGFGTWNVQPCAEVVARALEVGYRHLDTARKYGNEQEVGQALRASGVAREAVFVTTKVSHERLRAPEVERSVEESLRALALDYVDLLLVHWPSPDGVPLRETMGALSRAKRDGLARHIGVANFTIRLLEEAVAVSPEPVAVLQAEYHPYLDQSRLLSRCAALGVRFVAHCPLGRGRLPADPVLGQIARAKGRTPAQVALRWLVQQGVAAIPRTSNLQRVHENFQVFDFSLDDDEMRRLHELRSHNARVSNPPMAPAWD